MSVTNKLKNGIRSYLRFGDWLLLLSCLAASAYGVVLLYSVTVTAGSAASNYLVQIAASVLGITAAIVISLIDYDLICRLWPILAGVTLVLVLLTFTPLGLTVADDRAWLPVPIIGTFQPSELMKITFIITFSVHLSKVKDHINHFPTLLLVGLHGLVPIGLVFFQGDDGTALVFVCIFASMLLMAGLHPLYFLSTLTVGCLAVPFLWFKLDEDKQKRFLSLIFVNEYKQSIGWQQYEALKAIGSGQLWGVGYMEGGEHRLFARNNDFIFTVAGEEFGFVGSIVLLLILCAIIIALFRNLYSARDFRGMLICGGIMSMIGFQSLINIGMNLRLLPVIGITLPFFSRGGSSVATLYLAIGVALSVYYSSHARSSDSIFTRRNS